VSRTTVAVLFARADSVYKTLAGCDVYDMERDARTYDGPWPVVAHPPCRGWGRLRHMASPRADERNLARLAVALVREFGGVLEHPAASTLWPAQRLPAPGAGRDDAGGWTLGITQHWWGHRATKATKLYIVGCAPGDIPSLPDLQLGQGSHVVSQDGRRVDGSRWAKDDPRKRPECTKAEREHTPPALASWLVDLATRCRGVASPERPSIPTVGISVGTSTDGASSETPAKPLI
jgi:hypothetical protein